MQAVINQSLSLLDAVENLVASGTPESLTPLAAKLCQALFSYCAKRSVSGAVNLWLLDQEDQFCSLPLSPDDAEQDAFRHLEFLGTLLPPDDNFCPKSDFRLWTELHGAELCPEGDEMEVMMSDMAESGEEGKLLDGENSSQQDSTTESHKIDDIVTVKQDTTTDKDVEIKTEKNKESRKLKRVVEDVSDQEREEDTPRRISGRKRVLTAKMRQALEADKKNKTEPEKSDSEKNRADVKAEFTMPARGRRAAKPEAENAKVELTRTRRAVVVLKDIVDSMDTDHPSGVRRSARKSGHQDNVAEDQFALDSSDRNTRKSTVHVQKRRKIDQGDAEERKQTVCAEKMEPEKVADNQDHNDISDSQGTSDIVEIRVGKKGRKPKEIKKEHGGVATDEELGILVNALSSLKNSASSSENPPEVVALPVDINTDDLLEATVNALPVEQHTNDSEVNVHAENSDDVSFLCEANSKGPKFYCIYCNSAKDMVKSLSKAAVSFGSRVLMRKHIETKHVRDRCGKVVLDCPLCDMQTVTDNIDLKSMSNRMLKHVVSEHDVCYTETQLPGQEPKYYCFYCISPEAIHAGNCPQDKTFESQTALNKHIQKEHLQGSSFDAYLRCNMCDYEPHSAFSNISRAVSAMMHHVVKKHRVPYSNHVVLPDLNEERIVMPPWRNKVFICFYCCDLSDIEAGQQMEAESLRSRRDLSKHISTKHVADIGKSKELKCPQCAYSLHNTDINRMTNMMIGHMLEIHRQKFWTSSQEDEKEGDVPDGTKEDIFDTSINPQEEMLLKVEDSSVITMLDDYAIEDYDAIDSFSCMYCEANDIGIAFTTKSELHDHITAQHLSETDNSNTLDCPKCSFKLVADGSFSLESCVDMLEHINDTHKPMEILPLQTESTATPIPKKRGRKPGKMGEEEYICMFCNDPSKMMFGLENLRNGVFGTQKDLFIHLRDMHCERRGKEVAFHCPMCSRQTLGLERWFWGIMKRALDHLSSVHMLQYSRRKQKSYRTAAELSHMVDGDTEVVPAGETSNATYGVEGQVANLAVVSSGAEASRGDNEVEADCDDSSKYGSSEQLEAVNTDILDDEEADNPALVPGEQYFCLICARKQVPQVPTFYRIGELQTHVLEEHSFKSGLRIYLECVECQQQFYTQGVHQMHMAYRMLSHMRDTHKISFKTKPASQSLSDKNFVPPKTPPPQVDTSESEGAQNDTSLVSIVSGSSDLVEQVNIKSSAAEDELNMDSTDEEDHVDGETSLVYACLFCHISNGSVGELRQHLLESHVNVVSPDVFNISCPKCNWTCANSSSKDDLIVYANNFISHCILKHGLFHHNPESDVVSILLKAAAGDPLADIAMKTEAVEDVPAASAPCFVCSDGDYTDFPALCEHVQQEHMEGQGNAYIHISCPVCQNTYMCPGLISADNKQTRSFVEMLLSHMVKSHGLRLPAFVPVHHCDICGYETVVEGRMHSHSQSHASYVVTEVTQETVEVMPEKNPDGFYRCRECDTKFTEAFKWRRHMQRHSAKGVLCTICGRLSKKKHYLISHSWVLHKVNISGRSLMKCPDCGEEMVWTCMSKHIKKHQGPHREFTCAVCGVVSQGLVEYQKHKKEMHSQSGWYHCNDCDFKTKNINYLPKHRMLVHDKQDKISCSLCQAVFNNEDRLKVHLAKHHPEGQMTNYCSLCSRQLSSKIAYENHMFVSHSVNISTRQVMSCTICNFRTLGNSLLKAHMNNHRQVLFRCEICDHVSHSRAVYNAHKKRIHGNRRFQCDFCSHQSADRHTLLKHIAKRHTSVSYTCEYCNYVAVTEERLKKHQKTAHNVGREEESRMLTALMSEGSEALRKGMPVQIEVVNEENQQMIPAQNIEEQMTVYVADEQEQADIVAHALSEMANQGGEQLQEITEQDLPAELGNADIAVQALSQMSEGGEEVVVYTSGMEAQEEVVLQGENGEQIPYETIETVVQDGVSYYYLTLKDAQQ